MNIKYLLLTICILSAQAGPAVSKQRSTSPISERSTTPATPQTLPEIPSSPKEQYVFKPINPYIYQETQDQLKIRDFDIQEHSPEYAKQRELFTLAEAARAGDKTKIQKLLKSPTFQQPDIEILGTLARAQLLASGKKRTPIVKQLQNRLNLLQQRRKKQQKSGHKITEKEQTTSL